MRESTIIHLVNELFELYSVKDLSNSMCLDNVFDESKRKLVYYMYIIYSYTM